LLHSKENKYQPFWILVAGRRHYIFSDLTDAAAIHKNENDISIRNIKSFLYTQVFGVSKPDADLIWDVNKEAYSVDRRWLLGREEQAKMTSQYFRHVDHHMNDLTQRILQSDGKEISIDGLLTVVDLEGTSTIQTFYGDTTLRKHPQILEDMMYVVTKGFKPILFGMPRFLAPKPYAARDRIISAFAELAEELDQRNDVSGYFQERYTYINSRGVSRMAIGADMFRHLFA
jgi:DNA-binding transcriptional MerR regulator